MKVYMVYVIYEYDGYDNTEIYSTREKAVDAADQLLFEFQQDGYKINPDYADEDATFATCVDDTLVCIRLGNEKGDVEITIEEKTVR